MWNFKLEIVKTIEEYVKERNELEKGIIRIVTRGLETQNI